MKHSERGQILIIAIIIMGALLTIGLTLSGLIGTHLHNTIQFKKRSLAEQLSESGIEYLHQKLLQYGADWQPPLQSNISNRHPDYFYLKRGGPDEKGSYSSINLTHGRALIRARWVNHNEPKNHEEYGTRLDLSRYPGCILLESVGRSGKIKENDPTTLFSKPISKQDFYIQESHLKLETVKRVALIPLLILENLFTITNKDRHIRDSEILDWKSDWQGSLWSNSNLKIIDTKETYHLKNYNSAIYINGNDKNRNVKRLEPPLLLDSTPECLHIEGSIITADRGDKNLFASLTQDWINHSQSESEGWIGSYYMPPCIRLIFDREGFTVHHDPRYAQNSLIYERYFITRKDEEIYYWKEGMNEKKKFSGVISIDGDVGIKGLHPSGSTLTIKSKGTIYIEGPLVKSQDSKMALLAKHYICVNPTLFFAPENNLFDMGREKYGEETVFTLNRAEEDLVFKIFLNKINQEINPKLILFYKNRPNIEVKLEELNSPTLMELKTHKKEIYELIQRDIFKNLKQNDLNHFVTFHVRLRFNNTKTKSENFHFIRAAILPYHVTIQAAAYAEMGSFFVIPGPNFYPYSDQLLDINFEWEGSLAQNLTARWDQQELWLNRWCQPIESNYQQSNSRWNWKYDPLLINSARKNNQTSCELPPFAGLSVSKSRLYYGEDKP